MSRFIALLSVQLSNIPAQCGVIPGRWQKLDRQPAGT